MWIFPLILVLFSSHTLCWLRINGYVLYFDLFVGPFSEALLSLDIFTLGVARYYKIHWLDVEEFCIMWKDLRMVFFLEGASKLCKRHFDMLQYISASFGCLLRILQDAAGMVVDHM
jgi:hypothetical protein